MQILKINNTNFQARQRFIGQEGLTASRNLTKKMIEDAVYKEQRYVFAADLVAALKTKDGFFKSNSIYFLQPKICEERLNTGFTKIEFNKNRLVFNNDTGEITEFKKPLFRPFKKFIQETCEFLNMLAANYNNKEVVTKSNFKVSGLTQAGLERYMNLTNRIYYEGDING